MGLLKGKKAVCYPGMEEGLCDARVQLGSQVVVDGKGVVHFFPERYYAWAIPVTEFSNNNAVDAATDNNPGW